jgi:hypothetical protein
MRGRKNLRTENTYIPSILCVQVDLHTMACHTIGVWCGHRTSKPYIYAHNAVYIISRKNETCKGSTIVTTNDQSEKYHLLHVCFYQTELVIRCLHTYSGRPRGAVVRVES